MEVYRHCVLQNIFAESFKCSFLAEAALIMPGYEPNPFAEGFSGSLRARMEAGTLKVVVFEGHRSKSCVQVCSLENSMVKNGECLHWCSATTDPFADVELVCRDIALQKNSPRGPGSRSRLLISIEMLGILHARKRRIRRYS